MPEERLELSRDQVPGDFESPASTYSTTPAPILEKLYLVVFGGVNQQTLYFELPRKEGPSIRYEVGLSRIFSRYSLRAAALFIFGSVELYTSVTRPFLT